MHNTNIYQTKQVSIISYTFSGYMIHIGEKWLISVYLARVCVATSLSP